MLHLAARPMRISFVLAALSFPTVMRADDPPPIAVQPAGKELTIELGGLLHAQAEFGDQGDSRWDNGNDRIYLRRARVHVQGRFLEEFEFRFEADAAGALSAANGLRLQLTDGYVDWKRYRSASVRVGQFKTPYGFEQLFSDARLYTPERSLVSDRLALFRQLGWQVGGEVQDGRLSYAAGMFNGNGANNNNNDSDQFTYVGRLAGVLRRGVAFGHETKLALGGNAFAGRDEAVTLAADFGFDSTPVTPAADNVFDGQRVGSGVDLQWLLGRLDLWAEWLQVKFEPDNALPAAALHAVGWYVQGGFHVLSNKKLQAILRYETFDPSDRAAGDDRSAWTLGGNLFFKGDDIKLQAYYLRSEASGVSRKDQKAIVRIQVAF